MLWRNHEALYQRQQWTVQMLKNNVRYQSAHCTKIHAHNIHWLTHWGRVTHICVSKLTIIGPDNGLSPGRRQAIIWTNTGILLIGPLGTNFSENLSGIQTFSFKKMPLKMSSGKWRPSCLGLNVLNIRKQAFTRCFCVYRDISLFLIEVLSVLVKEKFLFIFAAPHAISICFKQTFRAWKSSTRTPFICFLGISPTTWHKTLYSWHWRIYHFEIGNISLFDVKTPFSSRLLIPTLKSTVIFSGKRMQSVHALLLNIHVKICGLEGRWDTWLLAVAIISKWI